MLNCGEDLGMMPDGVQEIVNQLAVTGVKDQRMPSENIAWYNPKDAD